MRERALERQNWQIDIPAWSAWFYQLKVNTTSALPLNSIRIIYIIRSIYDIHLFFCFYFYFENFIFLYFLPLFHMHFDVNRFFWFLSFKICFLLFYFVLEYFIVAFFLDFCNYFYLHIYDSIKINQKHVVNFLSIFTC